MNQALQKLLRLRLRAGARRMLRGMKTVRGAVFSLIGLATLVLWLGPNMVIVLAQGPRVDPEPFRELFPLGLLGICLLSLLTSSERGGIHFTPAEVDLLFSAPFTRRELLIYKLSVGLAGSLFAGLVFSVFFLRVARLWTAAFVGCLLALMAIQLLSTVVVLAGQTVAQRAYTRLRRLTLVVLIGLIALGISRVTAGGLVGGLLPLARSVNQSALGSLALAPLAVFGWTITADCWFPDFFLWATLAALVDLALLGLVLRLDVNYMESSISVSQKLYQRLQRARRGNMSWAAPSTAKWRLPPFPWLGGMGPTIRRQLTAALHSVRGLAMALLIPAMAMLPAVMLGDHNRGMQGGVLAFPLLFLTLIMTRMLPFDFRGDLDHLDWLKSLPLRPMALAAGQLVVPVFLMTVIQLLSFSALALVAGRCDPVLIEIAAFTPPLNLLLFAVDNLVFLLFPVRLVASTPGDFQHMGRSMVEMLLKTIALGLCLGVAAALGALAYYFINESWTAALVVAWLGLTAEAILLIPCIAWAYQRFDVSVDTPP